MKSLLFVFILLLSACSSLPDAPVGTQSWVERKAELSDVKHWFVTGRVAIKNGVESWHVNLLWLQQADDYQIRLSGPFGAGTVQLKGNSNGAELQTSDDKRYFSYDVDQLMFDATGVQMPLAELRHWMLGLPAPGSEEVIKLNADGRLQTLQQSDWKVRYRRYTIVNGVILPNKIFAKQNELDVRVVIDKWELGIPNEDNPFNNES